MIRSLLDAGADIHQRIPTCANSDLKEATVLDEVFVSTKQIDIGAMFLERKNGDIYDTNLPTRISYEDCPEPSKVRWTYLMWAINYSRNDILEYILKRTFAKDEKKASALLNYELTGCQGYNALCWALANENIQAVNLLLKYNIKVTKEAQMLAKFKKIPIPGVTTYNINQQLIEEISMCSEATQDSKPIYERIKKLLDQGANPLTSEEMPHADGKMRTNAILTLTASIILHDELKKTKSVMELVSMGKMLFENMKTFTVNDIAPLLQCVNLYNYDIDELMLMIVQKTNDVGLIGSFIELGRDKLFAMLLERDAVDFSQKSAFLLSKAIIFNRTKMVESILKYGETHKKDVGIDEIFTPRPYTSVAKKIMRAIFQSELCTQQNTTFTNLPSVTPYLNSIIFNNFKVFKLLIRAGAKVQDKHNYCNGLLFIVLLEREDMLRYLIRHQTYADFDAILDQKSDLHLLQLAKELNSTGEIIRLLKETQDAKNKENSSQISGLKCGFWETENNVSSSSRAYLLSLGFSNDQITAWRKNKQHSSAIQKEIPETPILSNAIRENTTKQQKITWGGGLLSSNNSAVVLLERSSVPLFVLNFFDHIQGLDTTTKKQFAAIRPHLMTINGVAKTINMPPLTIEKNGENIELPTYELKISGVEKRLFGVFFPADNNGPPLLCWFFYGDALHTKQAETSLKAWAKSTSIKPLTLKEIANSIKNVENEIKADDNLIRY